MSSSFPDPTSHDDCAYKPGNGTHVLYVEASNFYTSSVLESYTPLFALFPGLPRFFLFFGLRSMEAEERPFFHFHGLYRVQTKEQNTGEAWEQDYVL